ncbi:MAG TPA: 6-bladed beta-propeller, partial [Saprospiraceae bacterium]|nr:6-bladed beta-propeller [Saprospiraceae bacterium]
MIDLKEFYEVFKCTLLLVSCILCLTCKQSKVLIDDFVYVNPKEPLPVDWLHSEIKDNIQYIPLQSPYKSALGTISRCIVIDTICISTYRDRSGVFFHSLSGNFLHVLNATGKGPMEFDDVNEIAKFDNNHILINDPSKKSIIKYNFRERKIVGEYKTYVDIFSMYYQNEQLIYIGNNFKKGVVQ